MTFKMYIVIVLMKRIYSLDRFISLSSMYFKTMLLLLYHFSILLQS